MGERTQLLLRLHDENEDVKFSTILHYQWGFGRVMLMDTLNLVTRFPFYLNLGLDNAFGKGYEKAYYKWIGQTSSGVNYIGEIEDSDEYRIKNFAYHATEDDLWKCDNNDGFIVLDLFLGSSGLDSKRFERSKVSFFTRDWSESFPTGKQISFERYCKLSDDNYFTTSDFRKGWKLLARNFGIELQEPKKVKEK